jgi:hypothetical protein
LTLEEAGRELQVSSDGLKNRILSQGMTPEQAIAHRLSKYRKKSVFLTFNGVTLSTMEWESKLGLKRGNLRLRLQRGIPLEKALQPGDFRKLSRPRKASIP